MIEMAEMAEMAAEMAVAAQVEEWNLALRSRNP
jgi:hypothetical protein